MMMIFLGVGKKGGFKKNQEKVGKLHAKAFHSYLRRSDQYFSDDNLRDTRQCTNPVFSPSLPAQGLTRNYLILCRLLDALLEQNLRVL